MFINPNPLEINVIRWMDDDIYFILFNFEFEFSR